MLAETRVRANTAWVIAIAASTLLGLSGVIRDAFVNSWEVPPGIGIAAIFGLLLTAVYVGVTNDLDDNRVDNLIAEEKARGFKGVDKLVDEVKAIEEVPNG